MISNHSRLAEPASPEKLAVIGSVRTVSQEFDKPFYGAAVTDTDGNREIALIGINVSRNTVFGRPEKRFDFLRDFADSNHIASVLTSTAHYNTYRHVRLFLFNHHYHQKSFNRSV